MSLIYLDFLTTTPTAPSVVEAMLPYYRQHFLLPLQSHPQAAAVADAIEDAREKVAELLGSESVQIVLTGGGTEANLLGLIGSMHARYPPASLSPETNDRSPRVIVAAGESGAIDRAVDEMGRSGWAVDVVSPRADGSISVDAFEQRIRPTTRQAAVSLANATTGVIQPIGRIAKLCRNHDIRLHCDASAAAGRIPINADALDVDTLAISGHRIYGPKGSGALYVRRGLRLRSMLMAGDREMGLLSGCDNVPAIVGLGAAARLTSRGLESAAESMNQHVERLLDGLQRTPAPATAGRLATESRSLPGVAAIGLPMPAASLVSLTRHVVVGHVRSFNPPDTFARTLLAAGMDRESIESTARISVGWTTSRDQIERAVELIGAVAECP